MLQPSVKREDGLDDSESKSQSYSYNDFDDGNDFESL